MASHPFIYSKCLQTCIQHIQRVCTPSVSSCGVIPAVLSSQEMGAYLAGPPPTQAQTCLTAFLVHWHSLLEFWIHRSYPAAGHRPWKGRGNMCQGGQGPFSMKEWAGLSLSVFICSSEHWSAEFNAIEEVTTWWWYLTQFSRITYYFKCGFWLWKSSFRHIKIEPVSSDMYAHSDIHSTAALSGDHLPIQRRCFAPWNCSAENTAAHVSINELQCLPTDVTFLERRVHKCLSKPQQETSGSGKVSTLSRACRPGTQRHCHNWPSDQKSETVKVKYLENEDFTLCVCRCVLLRMCEYRCVCACKSRYVCVLVCTYGMIWMCTCAHM
jgi:hypothetical protein